MNPLKSALAQAERPIYNCDSEDGSEVCNGWMLWNDDRKLYVCNTCHVGLAEEECVLMQLTVASPKRREGDQPLPTLNEYDDIQTGVIADIAERRELGVRRYGTPLQPFNGRSARRDAYEEALDLAIYLKQILVEEEDGLLTFEGYQDDAATTAVYPGQGTDSGLAYTALGLTGEAGEVSNVVKKVLRGDIGSIDFRAKIKDELGDVLWYVAMIAKELGIDLNEIARYNLSKLAARAEAGTIKGHNREEDPLGG